MTTEIRVAQSPRPFPGKGATGPNEARNLYECSWLAAIVHSSSDAIISVTQNCVMQSWNRGAERLYGYSAAEAIGQPLSILIPKYRAGEEAKILERVRLLRRLAGGASGKDVSPVELLSDRELEVFELLGKGQKTKEIAEQLHLSVKTVQTYCEHLKEKLLLRDSTGLVRFAVQWVEAQK